MSANTHGIEMTESSAEIPANQNADNVDQQQHCEWEQNHSCVLQKWKSYSKIHEVNKTPSTTL